jgi:hypothetical protein
MFLQLYLARLLCEGTGHFLVPQQLPLGAVDACEMVDELAGVTTIVEVVAVAGIAGDVDPVADHDRARRPGTRQLGLPSEVLGVTPLGRRLGVAGDTVVAGTAKAGPLLGFGRGHEQRDDGDRGDGEVAAVHPCSIRG